MVTFAIFLPVAMALMAFVIDAGFAWGMKRHLQKSADAAALAGAQDLPDGPAATAMANAYSASAGGKNLRPGLPPVTTQVELLASNSKIKVTQSAESPAFFARVLGFSKLDVSAYAVASRASTTTGTPLAVYVHEVCGASTGNKGFIAGGEDMRIEGAIHSNGHWEIKNPGFVSVGRATVYRPPTPAPGGTSPDDPAHPQGSGCITTDQSDSTYCTGCAGGAVDAPAHGPWRDWVTPYNSAADVTAPPGSPCTFTLTNDTVFAGPAPTDPPLVIPDGVYCLPSDKKFTISGNVTGKITVIAGIFEVGGTGTLEPYDADVPVIFYSTNTTNVPITMNPSQAYDWVGYIINRWGGIKVNAAGVTSPLIGLLEAEWVEVNGEDFRMLGTFPDSVSGTTGGGVALEE
jgi:Flp pilus assembly protein TadG